MGETIWERIEFDTEHLLDLRRGYFWPWWIRTRIKILVVTDSGGFFDSVNAFGLGRVLDVVSDDRWPHVVFDFTTAHRGAAPADHTNFTFDTHDLSQYHQIWLFGVDRFGASISQSEVAAIARFMDDGGGVFATGDHEDLGVKLCGEVPRVRSMRRWYYPNPGPNGEPVAPAQTGAARHDTLTDDPATPGVDYSQTDKIPQSIEPTRYSHTFPGRLFTQIVSYPHPVLCGPDGPIVYLPDHMHEGKIEVPSDLTRSYTFAGYATDEYPEVNGFRQPPEVIAKATNFVTGQKFGVLGAYDGHRAGVGRVVVDATWHHWFNINMEPYQNASTPGHATYDPAVVPKWDQIMSYFRNVAVWLAPQSMQAAIRHGGWLYVVGFHEIQMTLQPLERLADPLPYYFHLGTLARDALGRLASRCQTVRWRFDLAKLPHLKVVPDPWDPRIPDPPRPDFVPFIDADDADLISLGGAIHALGEIVRERGEEAIEPLLLEDGFLDKVAVSGGEQALGLLMERYQTSCRGFETAE